MSMNLMRAACPAASHTACARSQIGARRPVPRLNSPLTAGIVEQPQHDVDDVADPDEVARLLAIGQPGHVERNSRAGPPAATSSYFIFTTEIMRPLWYSFGP